LGRGLVVSHSDFNKEDPIRNDPIGNCKTVLQVGKCPWLVLICVLNLGGEASRQSLRDEVNSVKFVNVEKITGEYSVFVSDVL